MEHYWRPYVFGHPFKSKTDLAAARWLDLIELYCGYKIRVDLFAWRLRRDAHARLEYKNPVTTLQEKFRAYQEMEQCGLWSETAPTDSEFEEFREETSTCHTWELVD